MGTQLVLSVIGKERPELLDELTRAILECGCSVGESRMTVIGREFAAIMMLTGNWNAVAKLESVLPRLAQTLDVSLDFKRTEARAPRARLLPYAVEIIAADRAGIVQDVAGFFAKRGISVEDLATGTYLAPHTGAAMFSLVMTIGVPADSAIAALRGEFMDLCDELNLDAMFAPVK